MALTESEELELLELRRRRAMAEQTKTPSPTLDWKNVVKQAIRESAVAPGTMTRKLATDPVTQAKALPYLAGTAGSIAPIPGGTTLGTVGGRQLSNLALRAYGKPEEIPSLGQQLVEGATSAIADIVAIPAIKKGVYGKAIGRVEKAGGVPPAQDIPTQPMSFGTKSVGEFIDDAVSSVKTSGMEGTPSYWLSLKDTVDRIYKRGAVEKLSSIEKGKLKWLSRTIQEGLNKAVPGRAAPAQALSRSMAIPKAIKKGYETLPEPLKRAMERYAIPGIVVEEIWRRNR